MAVYPLLAMLWALVLLPPMVRRRVRSRAEFADFDRMRLRFVGSTPSPPHGREEVVQLPVRRSATQRRRRVLTLIGAGMIGTLVVALILRNRVAWGMHLLVYDVLIAYVGLLARTRDRQASRRLVGVPDGRSVPATPLRRIPRATPLPSHPAALPELLHAASR